MVDEAPVAQGNSEGNPAFQMNPDAELIKAEHAGGSPDAEVKIVPPLPPNAEEGDVTRTAGPSAEATLEANVGVGHTVVPVGVADAALGQHSKGENEPVEGMAGIVEAHQASPAVPETKSSRATKS